MTRTKRWLTASLYSADDERAARLREQFEMLYRDSRKYVLLGAECSGCPGFAECAWSFEAIGACELFRNRPAGGYPPDVLMEISVRRTRCILRHYYERGPDSRPASETITRAELQAFMRELLDDLAARDNEGGKNAQALA